MKTGKYLTYDECLVGQTHGHDYMITAQIYEGFLRLFGDSSPLHVDSGYAETCGFAQPLMHGAILNGFISHFVGMVFPGGMSLELSVDLRFSQPCYLGDRIYLEGKIAQKLDSQKVVVVHLSFLNQTRLQVAANARVQIKMMGTLPPSASISHHSPAT